MTTIKLEIPETNAAALYHFGEALRNVALAEGFIAPSNTRKTTVTRSVGDISKTVIDEPLTQAERDELVEQFDDVEPITPPEAEFTEQQAVDHIGNANDNPMDVESANDIPWDQRIHSRGKTQLADGTWRYSRKPADKTKEEWDLYVEEVEAELKALMLIPVVTHDIDTDTPHGMSEANEAPVVEAPVVEAPEIVTPEVVATHEVVATGPQTFGELMRFITANGKKLNNDIVKQVLTDNGLASIALLAARVDLIPQIHQVLLGKL